jgi:hypothetical protein
MLRNGERLSFWSRRRPSRARPGLWDGNGYKKIASGGKWGYIGSHPKGKTEIPAEGQLLSGMSSPVWKFRIGGAIDSAELDAQQFLL